MLIDGYPPNMSMGMVIFGIFFMMLTFSPHITLAALNSNVEDQSIKSWIVLILSVLIVLTTFAAHSYTYFIIPEDPQNAQAGIGLLFVPLYQLFAGGLLGGVSWGIASFINRDE